MLNVLRAFLFIEYKTDLSILLRLLLYIHPCDVPKAVDGCLYPADTRIRGPLRVLTVQRPLSISGWSQLPVWEKLSWVVKEPGVVALTKAQRQSTSVSDNSKACG